MRFKPHYKQLRIDEFFDSFNNLPKNNRWVALGDNLPWDAIDQMYQRHINNKKVGRREKPSRMVIGAMIIKHTLKLSDIETISQIQENPFMQYMVGLEEYNPHEPIFDPSLLTYVRKRLDIDDINFITAIMSGKITEFEESCKKSEDSDSSTGSNLKTNKHNSDSSSSSQEPQFSENDFVDESGQYHKGSLKIDATCCDAEVRYPTDLDLLHDGLEVTNQQIKILCKALGLKLPNTNMKKAEKYYQRIIKKRRKSRNAIRSTIEKLLAYLKRDKDILLSIIAKRYDYFYLLPPRHQRLYKTVLTMYHQQLWMFKSNKRSCKDRIISLFQDHIRPIVRGKAKARTEFGAKIGAAVVDGFTYIDQLSWDAYNEKEDLIIHVQKYKERFGYLPAKIYADKIYMNRDNRRYMKAMHILQMCPALGRPPKEAKTPEYKAKMAKASGERNEVEATFGTMKRAYGANNIRAKLPNTSACWIGMCAFVKNIKKFMKVLLFVPTFIRGLLIFYWLEILGLLWSQIVTVNYKLKLVA